MVDPWRRHRSPAEERRSETTQRHRVETFERSSREIARARRFVVGALADWGCDADTAGFELMVSELVSNALTHGAGAISVQVSLDGAQMRLEVSDDGAIEDRPHLDPRTVGGWGLRFVDELADSWGTAIHEGSTLVWAVMRTPSGLR